MIWTAYGPPEVLQYQEIDKPIPKAHQILIKISNSTVTAGDCEMRKFQIPRWVWLPLRLFTGIFRPRIKVLGQEFSGEVVEVGANVQNFSIGDKVFLSGGVIVGGYAEYACVSSKRVIGRIPDGVAFEEATTIPTGGINGLHFLRKGKVRNGTKLLINGAGGSIGTYAVQLAKLYGAEVTCVDSEEKLKILGDLGADHLIDYRKVDFTKSGEKYDVIIDIVGKSHFNRSLKMLNDNGYYVMGNPSFRGMMRGLLLSLVCGFSKKQKHVAFEFAVENHEDYEYMINLIKSSDIKVFIDKRYPLKDLVSAHGYVDRGLKTGNVIIDI